MRTSLIKGLVDSLGERGHISLPLVEQLLPVIAIGDLSQLGSPVGIPVCGYTVVGSVPAQRTGIFYAPPAGTVLRIDRIRANNDASIALGKMGTPPTGDLFIADWRRANGTQTGTVRAHLPWNDIAAQWLAGFGLAIIGHTLATEWWLGPVYLTYPGCLAIWDDVDALVEACSIHGELFELG